MTSVFSFRRNGTKLGNNTKYLSPNADGESLNKPEFFYQIAHIGIIEADDIRRVLLVMLGF